MNIAILGAGNVGASLGGVWSAKGHRVVYGVRNPADPKYATLNTATPAEAARTAEVVVLATPWPATKDAIEGAGGLAGKIVLDATNPLEGLKLAVGFTDSGGEMVARWAPGARVVKIFNSTGNNNMENTAYPGGTPAMFYAGDDAAAKSAAAQLAADLGFEPVDAGPLTNARLLEPLALLWIDQAFFRGRGREFAIALLKR
ncbi:MAG TPA: hypothetical protein DEH78_12570 [Solibacterales bacterium]|nr:hypothetical protein [Bryobacterales bacterium]